MGCDGAFEGPWLAISRLVSSNQSEVKMQRSTLNRATMPVADTTEVSGRVLTRVLEVLYGPAFIVNTNGSG